MLYKNKGFTLAEVMVVVAILAIVAAIAIPSYQNIIRKSNRSDAKNALNLVANEQARFYAINRAYTTDMTNFSLDSAATAASAVSLSGQYKLKVIAGASGNIASSYKIIADTNTTAQGRDLCKQFTLDSAGVKTASDAACWK